MIGFAFSLTGALVEPQPLEERTFVALARAVAAEQRLALEAAHVAEAARRFADASAGPPAQRSAALVAAFADATGLRPAPDVIAARFRSIGETLAETSTVERPGARTVLARLADLCVPHAVLAGGWSGIEHRRAARLGLTGPLLTGDDLGVAPPDPAAFAAVAEALRLPPASLWFVGSDPAGELEPAERAGLRPVPLAAGGLDALTPLICESYTRALLDLRYVLHNALHWRRGHFIPGVEYGLNDPARLAYVLPADDA